MMRTLSLSLSLFLLLEPAFAQDAESDSTPAPIILRTGQTYAQGVKQLIVAREGRTLISRGWTNFQTWDVATGFENGNLLGPDGREVEIGGTTSISADGHTLFIPTPDQILLLDLRDMTWARKFDFPGASSVLLDADRKRLIVSRNEEKRNMLYTIDLESGAETLVARLRGADRQTKEPQFTQMRLRGDGTLLGINDEPSQAEFFLLDTSDWRLLRNHQVTYYGSYTTLPSGNILAIKKLGASASLFLQHLDGSTFEEIASMTVPFEGESFAYEVDSDQAFDRKNNRVLVRCNHGAFWVQLDGFTQGESYVGSTLFEGLRNLTAAVPDPSSGHLFVSATAKTPQGNISRLFAWNPRTRQNVQQFGYEGFIPSLIIPIPGELGFYAHSAVGVSKRVSFQNGQVQVTAVPAHTAPRRIAPDGKRGVASHFGTAIDRLALIDSVQARRLETREIARTPRKNGYSSFLAYPDDYAFAPDGQSIAVISDGGMRLYDIGGQELWQARVGAHSPQHQPHATLFSLDGSIVLVEGARAKTDESPENRKITALEASTGAALWEQTMFGERALLRVFPDGRFLCLERHRGQLEWRQMSDGSLLESIDLPGILPMDPEKIWKRFGFALNRDRTQVAIWQPDGTLTLYDTATARPVRDPVMAPVKGAKLAFLEGDEFLLSAVGNTFHILRTDDLAEVARLALFQENNEWLVASSDQRFDATTEAQDFIYYQQGQRVIPLRLLFERAYTPNLLGRLMAGESIPSPDLSILPEPPTVFLTVADFKSRGLTVEDDISAIRVESERVKLRIEARGGSSFLDEVRLFQNGKALAFNTRGLTVENDVPDAGPETVREIEVLLLPGENHFSAVALNQAQIESSPSELNLLFERASAATGGIHLHLVVVGVNQYQNPRYNLNYAVPDAQAFRDAILAGSKRIFGDIHTTFLMDADVSQASVLQALREVSHRAGPRDVLIFYYAGHGVMSASTKPEFFLVPPDVTQLYGNNALLTEKAISAAELRDLARAIPAQKQLFVLDACQSAGALEDVAMRGAAEEKAIATLARSTGTYWLTATGSEQFAAEFEQLGHGVFTYALLEAIRGAADNGDGQLTVRELDAFLQGRVPELTREHRGTPQYPASYGFGQDFPLSLVAP